MLLDFLTRYLREVEDAVRQAEGAYVERYEEEIVAADRVNLRIRVRYRKGHMLELNEAVIGELPVGQDVLAIAIIFRTSKTSLSFDLTTRRISRIWRISLITNIFRIRSWALWNLQFLRLLRMQGG